ncbi:precorrin-2 dehydrogenase/sirohydrochlorin ferrochelatase family protein [Paenibacillus marinisediminis]
MGNDTGLDEEHDYPQYAIMLNLKCKLCTVIGGGRVATRKIRQLLECGAEIKIISPVLSAELAELVEQRAIQHVEREYEECDINGACLVFAATDDPIVNEQVAIDCQAAQVLVNVAHASTRSDFTNPGVLRYGPVQVTVSTGGASPTLTRHIIDKVDHIIDDRIAVLADKLHRARSEAQRHIEHDEQRMEWLRRYSDLCWAAWERKEPFPEWSQWEQRQWNQISQLGQSGEETG